MKTLGHLTVRHLIPRENSKLFLRNIKICRGQKSLSLKNWTGKVSRDVSKIVCFLSSRGKSGFGAMYHPQWSQLQAWVWQRKGHGLWNGRSYLFEQVLPSSGVLLVSLRTQMRCYYINFTLSFPFLGEALSFPIMDLAWIAQPPRKPALPLALGLSLVGPSVDPMATSTPLNATWKERLAGKFYGLALIFLETPLGQCPHLKSLEIKKDQYMTSMSHIYLILI